METTLEVSRLGTRDDIGDLAAWEWRLTGDLAAGEWTRHWRLSGRGVETTVETYWLGI